MAEGRITDVDAKAAAASDSASKARRGTRPKRRTRPAKSARPRNARAAGIEARNPQADLRDRAQRRPRPVQARQGRCCRKTRPARSTPMVSQLKADKKAVWVEIEGHTDNIGDARLNQQLGLPARRSREAVSLRAAPDAAAQDQRDQLRRREAGGAEQHQGRPRTEPPRRDQGARVRHRRQSAVSRDHQEGWYGDRVLATGSAYWLLLGVQPQKRRIV